MIRHYITIAFRNQLKNKLFSIINIFGLAIGISVAFLLINYVSKEYSYDKMHSKYERIYRVESRFYEGDILTDDWATSSFGYGKAIKKEISGIENMVRIGVQNTEQTVSYQNKKSRETGIAYASSSFFTIFDFQMISGNINDQLIRPNTVIITDDIAKRLFKDENPIGKILTFASGSNFFDCEVTGVIENFPKNSHIRFNYLISYQTLPEWMKETWYLHEAYTYLLLEPGINPHKIKKQFPQMAEKYKTHEALRNKTWAVSLVPLKEIHLKPQKQYERESKGNRNTLVTLIIIAFVILLTAWINYINLTTAKSIERAKEIGIRKVSGAFQSQLIKQYLSEAVFMNLLAAILAIVLIIMLHPLFNMLIGENVSLYILHDKYFWILCIFTFILGVLASGLYPAFILTRIKPSTILKGNYTKSGSAGRMRQILVVFQFAASIFLICGSFIVYKQIHFMETQDLGVDINKTIVLKYPVSRNKLKENVIQFSKEIERKPLIQKASVTGSVPGMEVACFASNRLQSNPTQNRLYEMLTVDDRFIDAFGFHLLAGRGFKESFGNDHESILINESAMHTLGLNSPEEALNQKVLLESLSEPVTIIGVVQNWHQRDPGNNYTPIMFLYNGSIGWVNPRFIAIKTNSNNYADIIASIKTDWESYFPDANFDYFFLDQFFDIQYKTYRQFGRIVGIFTGLALFIAILGLWALAAYSLSQKVKEVGVRKVLGAQTLSIIYQFSKEIVSLILIALVIAVPLSWIFMRHWLMNYAFHINISGWIYALGGITTMGIAILTVTWQSWKAATRNPVEALRYE